MIQLPVKDSCEFCEGMAGRDERWTVIEETDITLTIMNPWQFEEAQCCVITRRHVGTMLDLSTDESAAIIGAAKRVAKAILDAYEPLAILTYQNNGVYSGQEVPHYHFHVVPRQQGSDWGIGPPQLAVFPTAGRERGTKFDDDLARFDRVHTTPDRLRDIAGKIRARLPD